MTERLIHDQQLARLLGRAAELQAQESTRDSLSDAGERAQPGDSHHLADIKAAAAEAGIDEQFVTLAALELATGGTTGAASVTPLQRRRAARWLGARELGLVQVGRVHAPLERLMAAIGSTVQMPQYGLRLVDSTPDLSRGGTMLLKLPESVIHAGNVRNFVYYLRGTLAVDTLRLTLARRGEQDHELGAAVDLAQAWSSAHAWSLGLAVCFAAVGAGVVAMIAAKLALPLVATLPLAAVAVALGAWFGALLMRRAYANFVEKARQQLQQLLDEIDGAVRSQAVFGVLPPSPPEGGANTDDTLVAAVVTVDV